MTKFVILMSVSFLVFLQFIVLKVSNILLKQIYVLL